MNGLDGQFLPGNNSVLMHQTRTVCPYDVFSSRIDVTLHLVTPHLPGYGMFLHRKHTAKTATFIRTFWLYNLNTFHQRQQIAKLIIIRYIQLTRRRKMHQADPMTTVLNTYLVRKRSLQGSRLHYIVNKLTNIIDFSSLAQRCDSFANRLP